MRKVFCLAALIITSPAWSQTATPQAPKALTELSGKITDFETELTNLGKTLSDARAASAKAQIVLGAPGVLHSRFSEITGANRAHFVVLSRSPLERPQGPPTLPPELIRFDGRFPAPLADDVQASLRGFPPLLEEMRLRMPELKGFETRSASLAEGFRALDARLQDLEAFRTSMLALVALAKQRNADAQQALLDAMAAHSPRVQCMLTGIDRTSAGLRDLVTELEAATKEVRGRVNETTRVLVAVDAFQADFERLLKIDSSAETLQRQVVVMAQSLAEVDSQLHSKVDLSFPYWGTTPEGRFGEILFPLRIETETLLKGSKGVQEYVERTLSPSLLADAEEFGIKWVIHDVDADVPSVLAQLKGKMQLVSQPKVEGLQDLKGIVANATEVIARLESFGLVAPVAVADASQPNYGFLKMKQGTDYRNMEKSLNTLSPQSLSSGGNDFCR